MAEALTTPNISIDLIKRKLSECHKAHEEVEGYSMASINSFKQTFQKTISECHQRALNDNKVNSPGKFIFITEYW